MQCPDNNVINVSLTTFEDVHYAKHLYNFSFFFKEPKVVVFYLAVFLCNILAIQCAMGCILSNFSLSQARVRTGKLDRIGRSRDLRVHL